VAHYLPASFLKAVKPYFEHEALIPLERITEYREGGGESVALVKFSGTTL
jgi:hypothetical protein